MTDQRAFSSPGSSGKDTGVAAVGTLASLTALFSAAACCVLPLALAGLGIGAGGLSGFVPYRWPLTIAAAVAIAVGWALYLRRRRACIADANRATSAPSTATLAMLSIATVVVAVSALWGFIEQPLMRALGGV
ncbi:MAG: hypothetical protein LC648_05880 [Novosphingobium sp.]|nr:hypothetical protein [Novosphingobium sp.]